jgi:acetolactate synthase-1/2/3 large subunit
LASDPKTNTRTAAQLLVAELEALGVDRVFCVPGESYLAVLDALYGRPIEVVTCRHESGAGFMAVADAKLTGRPGVCLVSRGPGASNAAIAVHTAQQDAAPLVLFVGQVERKDRGRGAFQEVNYERTFGDMAKLVVEVSDPLRLAEVTTHAFHVASMGVPGPVVIVLPEDMLIDPAPAPVLLPRRQPFAGPASDALANAAALLRQAERPLLIAGGGSAPRALCSAKSPRPGTYRSPRASASRTSSTTSIASLPAIWGTCCQGRKWRFIKRAISFSPSAHASAM